jgi:D-3-phosphoglycerate dehydrogenase
MDAKPSADLSSLTLLRWGVAEYEQGALTHLPDGVEVVTSAGPDAPLEDADVLVVPSTRRVDTAAVKRLRRCRLVITSTSGHDHLDLAALEGAGIIASRLPLARRDAVVETALGMILSLTRRLIPFQAAAFEGRWERARLAEYNATRLGVVAVVGVGVIGARMVEVLAALGAEVVAIDPRLPGSPSLMEVLPRADVVTLHCSLGPSSVGLIGADELAAMKPGSILVNTARGRLVDVEGAVAAVRAGHLGGLGLDVFPREPAPIERWAAPNVLLLPHAAGWHPGLGRAISEGVGAAVRALRAGEPVPFRVHPGD